MKKTVLILIASAVLSSAGMAVAYYNTASVGYDNANLISFYDGGVYLFDFDINYDKAKNDIKNFLPEKLITI